MLICSTCGFRSHSKRVCHCATCHLSFGGVTGFDAHRTGSHFRGERTCLGVEAVAEIGYKEDEKGIWRDPKPDTRWK